MLLYLFPLWGLLCEVFRAWLFYLLLLENAVGVAKPDTLALKCYNGAVIFRMSFLSLFFENEDTGLLELFAVG